MAGFRLGKGGLIDRSSNLTFSFDGKAYSGHQGDTLASALIANGVHLMGRSFKYHRPRGVIAAGAAEPNALVELREGGRREGLSRRAPGGSRVPHRNQARRRRPRRLVLDEGARKLALISPKNAAHFPGVELGPSLRSGE